MRVVSDKTFGVKVSDQLYDKVKAMIESSGSSSKEWFEKAVALTEVQELKSGSPDYKQDLSELEIHTTRIYELVANMIQRANYIKDDAVRDLNEKLNSRDFTIASLQSGVKEAQERLAELEEETKRNAADKEELANQLEGQRSVNANNQALIQEYKEKIDTLSSLVNQYKGYATENAELKESFAAEKESMISEFHSSSEELRSTVRDQQEQIEKLTQTNKSLEVNHKNELTRLTEAKDLEKERAVLEVERQYQEKLQEIHNQYNEKLARLYEKFETSNNTSNNNRNSQSKQTNKNNKQ